MDPGTDPLPDPQSPGVVVVRLYEAGVIDAVTAAALFVEVYGR